MNESEILKDVLQRLDAVTQHIIEIKSEMYRASDFKVDAARMYDQIGTIQQQSITAVKEAVMMLDRQTDQLRSGIKEAIDDHTARLNAVEAAVVDAKRPRLPTWLLVSGSAIGTALLSQVVQTLASSYQIIAHK